MEQGESSIQQDRLRLNVSLCQMPDEKCVRIITEWIRNAQKTIIVQTYSFSSEVIANALIDAKKNGKNVSIYIDKDAEQKKHSLIPKLRDNGILIQVDQGEGRAHNKVMMIDDDRVITGSYNWTDDKYFYNSDDLLFINDKCVAENFRENYNYNVDNNQHSYLSQKLSIPGLKPKNPCDVALKKDADINSIFPDYSPCSGGDEQQRMKIKSEYYVEINSCFPRYFNQECSEMIASAIREAKSSIMIKACVLTYVKISNKLINAHDRKIDIKLLIDKKALKDKCQKVKLLTEKGIKVKIDKICYNGTAHSKTMIIDDDVVLTGSYNYSYCAENRNLENLLHLRNSYVNRMFRENFNSKWDQANDFDSIRCEERRSSSSRSPSPSPKKVKYDA